MRAATRKGSGNWPTSDVLALRRGGRLRRSSLLCTIVAAGVLAGKAGHGARDEVDTAQVRPIKADSIPFGTDSERSARLLRSGTAFFVTKAGELLTSGHIVRGCRRIDVWTDDGARLAASLTAIDARMDVALLTTRQRVSLIPVFREGPLSRHEPVFTIGYGLTASTPLQPVITRGRVNGTVDEKSRRLLVMQAALYEGNSGGPVLDEHGLLIGMVAGRYANEPDLGVAIRAGDLARFLDVSAVMPQPSADRPPGAESRQTLRKISALVQCAD
ncbi:S1 family peptidase [Burkholderia sp. 8Y]|uniref:S1 family peptidase n=1 Tax=Burkholderia sp. 8Y TaxID=2653133 RepID=UPI001F1E88C5|nr:serine protease [Burkholderia sp. 8Y]